jgi:predicted dehydrogenase
MEELKVGVIGYGYIAKIHMAILKIFSNVKVTSVFSRTEKKVRGHRGISFYKDYNKMLEKEKLDIAMITTPTHTHQEISCACAEKGIDIFLEKPMARNMIECDKIIDSMNENNVRLFVGHNLRFWQTYANVKNYLEKDNSEIGTIQAISSKRISTFPWSKWFADQKKSGGVILDLSIHDIDYVLWILGTPMSVSCKASKINRYGMNLFGESITNLNYQNVKAECEASWAKPEDFELLMRTKIIGSDGYIEFDEEEIYNREDLQMEDMYKSANAYYNQLEHFFDVIVNREKSFLISPNEAKQAVKVCLASIKSAENEGKEFYLEDF